MRYIACNLFFSLHLPSIDTFLFIACRWGAFQIRDGTGWPATWTTEGVGVRRNSSFPSEPPILMMMKDHRLHKPNTRFFDHTFVVCDDVWRDAKKWWLHSSPKQLLFSSGLSIDQCSVFQIFFLPVFLHSLIRFSPSYCCKWQQIVPIE